MKLSNTYKYLFYTILYMNVYNYNYLYAYIFPVIYTFNLYRNRKFSISNEDYSKLFVKRYKHTLSYNTKRPIKQKRRRKEKNIHVMYNIYKKD